MFSDNAWLSQWEMVDTMFQMEIVHNDDNDHLDWLFHWNIFLLRESASIMSGNGKGFTLKELFRSPFTEL